VVTPHAPHRRSLTWSRRGAAALAVATAALLLSPVSPGLAQPPTAAAPDPAKTFRDLEKRADALEKEYRGGLETLGDAKKSAKRATDQAERTGSALEKAREDVRRLAASSYMRGGFDSASALLSAPQPGSAGGADVVEYLARDNVQQVRALTTLAAGAEQSRKAAQARIDKVRKEVDELEGQRTRVKKLLAKYKPETPARPATTASGGRPDGAASGAKSTIIGNTMTARMRTVLLEVDGKFGAFPAIGCYRAGDPQDHGSGRACDFMESTGGNMPSASAKANGDSVAQYVISNASRLGIKYVIWRQRIYDLRNPGWRAMEDRGSITANHYDHVHISVF
jgi:phage shock protein A